MTTVQIQKEQKSELHSKLCEMANELRGNMEAYEFKNYILGLIFYKFLSNKIVKTLNEELVDDDLTFDKVSRQKSKYHYEYQQIYF